MSEKPKRNLKFMSLKLMNHGKSSGPSSPVAKAPVMLSKARLNSVDPKSSPRKKLSAGGLKELVQCPLCMAVFSEPKMMPCQHTFCRSCLADYFAAGNSPSCPTCKAEIQVSTSTFVDDLPSNLYIDSLLQLVASGKGSPRVPGLDTPQVTEHKAVGLEAPARERCMHCRSMKDEKDVKKCAHCKQIYCEACWSQHLDDMQTQIGSILKQLDVAAIKLNHKIVNHKDHCEYLVKQINLGAEEKINSIIAARKKLLDEVVDLQKNSDMTASAIQLNLEETRDLAAKALGFTHDVDENYRVSTFMTLHCNAISLQSEVNKYGLLSYAFDREQFCIKQDTAMTLEVEETKLLGCSAENNPLSSEENLVSHYKTRNFTPTHVWRKCSRPAGVNVAPWNNALYVCVLDSHSVVVLERTHMKIVSRLTHENMLCPVQVAFLESLGEVYVTDKWKHCVHVFNKEGEYVRCIGQKGSRPGMFRSPEGIATDEEHSHIYVVDTGNDRVQVLQTDGKFVDQYGILTKPQPTNTPSVWQNVDSTCTEFNAPTSVAVTNNRVIVLDCGNRRVKVYNKSDKNKIAEFGSMGQRNGQFRQPAVLNVDPMGFILVGDSGNSRVQVFKENGQLIRVFGKFGTESGQFGWISGIHVTKQLEVIVSDCKNHTVSFM